MDIKQRNIDLYKENLLYRFELIALEYYLYNIKQNISYLSK